MIYEERYENSVLWWTRLPRIPISVEDAKALPQVGNIVFICDCESRGHLRQLIDIVKEKNPLWDICVWHNHKRDRMITMRRHYGSLVHSKQV